MNTKLLQTYLEAGVDEIISEVAINRLDRKIEENLKAKEVQITSATTPKSSQPKDDLGKKISTLNAISLLANKQKDQPENTRRLVSITENIAKASLDAEKCQTLEELEKAVRDFDGCSLKKMATNTVFADGNPESKIMIIGEAPGNDEDLQGIPFCGDSGKLLDAMFKTIGFTRQDLYITSTLFWRPPGNRRPTADELAMCKPFVEKHIALIKPKLIVLMGSTAMVDILNINDPISKSCGKFFDYQNQHFETPIKSIVLFHPTYLMRQSSKKRETWAHLLKIKEFLKNQ
ncbi:MAG: DNA polymerase [Rickettsiales bacterium]|jgi:DNA polymerase